MPAALLIVNLGAPFRIRGGTDIETAEYADGCVVTMPTRALEFGYPLRTRSVGVHFKPWGLAPFLPMPAAELCDRPVTVELVWGRPAIAELRDRLAAAGRLICCQSDSSRHANLGSRQSRGEPRGQGGHVQLGVGGRLHRGRE